MSILVTPSGVNVGDENRLRIAAILLATAFATAGATSVAASPAPTERVLVEGPPSTLRDILDRPDVTVTYRWLETGWIGIAASPSTIDALADRPDLRVEPDRRLRIRVDAGASAAPDDQTPYGIEQIYDDPTISATSGGSGVALGHLDTGIDTDHPDLVNRIVHCESTVLGNCEDVNGHGTHTAGTAAADAGSLDQGIYGVAPEASIRTYKVCTDVGLCLTSDINQAIKKCTDTNGERVCDAITFSIGSDGESDSMHDAIRAFVDAGGLFVAAAGNDGSSLESIDFPAAFDETAAVAAIDENEKVADFSSRGDDDGNCGSTKHDVDLAAAGVDVLSTWNDGGYNRLDGTSMATPHVSGLALKEWGGDGATTYSNINSNVEDITSGTHAGSGCDPASGQGLPHVG